jgi:hypothetical protein
MITKRSNGRFLESNNSEHAISSNTLPSHQFVAEATFHGSVGGDRVFSFAARKRVQFPALAKRSKQKRLIPPQLGTNCKYCTLL